jgi:hypothetical protein
MSVILTLSDPSRWSAAASASATDALSGGPFAWLQELMGRVPELAQSLILVLAGRSRSSRGRVQPRSEC